MEVIKQRTYHYYEGDCLYDPYPFKVFLEASQTGVASQTKKGIGYPWSSMYPPKDKPCLLPLIGVLAMGANSNLHRTYYGELPFIPQASLLLSTFLDMIHLLGSVWLGEWKSRMIENREMIKK